MKNSNYDIQTKSLEALIPLGFYDQLLNIYQNAFFSDLPHLYKMPSVTILNHLLTLATLFPHSHEKQTNKEIYNSMKRLYGPVSLRAMDILDTFYRIAASSNPNIDHQGGDFLTQQHDKHRHQQLDSQISIHNTFGELNSVYIIQADRDVLRQRLIELVSLMQYGKGNSRQANNSGAGNNGGSAEEATTKVLGHEFLTNILSKNFWKAFNWAIHCSQFIGSQQVADQIKYQCWRGWFPIQDFMLNVLELDLIDKASQECTVESCAVGGILMQLGSRSSVSAAVRNIFNNRYDFLPANVKDTITSSQIHAISQVYPSETECVIEQISMERDDYSDDDDSKAVNSDVLYLQKKFLFLIYRYLILSSRGQHATEFINVILQYMETFSIDELNEFIFIQTPTTSITITRGLGNNINIDNNDLSPQNHNSMNTLVLQLAIAMLSQLSKTKLLSSFHALLHQHRFSSMFFLDSLSNVLAERENLIALLEVEPSLLWRRSCQAPEFANMDILKSNSNGDKLTIEKLKQFIAQKNSYFSKVLKINLLTYYVLQLWISYNLSLEVVPEKFKQAVLNDRDDFLGCVKKCEEFKLQNMKLVIKSSLVQHEIVSEKDKSFDDKIDQLIRVDQLSVISDQLGNLFSLI